MGCKSKGLYRFLEDTPEDIDLNLRKESRHERALAQAIDDRQQAVNDADAAKLILAQLTNSSDSSESRSGQDAANLTIADANSRVGSADEKIEALYKKNDKIRQRQDTLMFLLSKVLDTTNSIKV